MEIVVPDDQGAELPPKPPARDHHGGFSFSISFGGRKPSVDDATYEPIQERAMKDAESPPGGIGSAADTHAININFSGGESRAQDSDRIPVEDRAPTQEEMSEAEMWDRIAHIGTGAYPDTAKVHRALRIVATVLGLAIPVALCVLGIATGQSGETIFYMTVFGLIVGVMFISTFP